MAESEEDDAKCWEERDFLATAAGGPTGKLLGLLREDSDDEGTSIEVVSFTVDPLPYPLPFL